MEIREYEQKDLPNLTKLWNEITDRWCILSGGGSIIIGAGNPDVCAANGRDVCSGRG